MERVVIVGNGPSKVLFDREKYKDYKIITCNFPSIEDDFCVIQDKEVPPKYIPERNSKTVFLLTGESYNAAFRNKWWFEAWGPRYEFLDEKSWMNSGLYALEYALNKGAMDIYIFGFDVMQTDEYQSSSGNVELSEERKTLYKNWRRVFKEMCDKTHPLCSIILVYGDKENDEL